MTFKSPTLPKPECKNRQCKKSYDKIGRQLYCSEQCRWDVSNRRRGTVNARIPKVDPKHPGKIGSTQRRKSVAQKIQTHIVIPDTQCAPGTPTAHLEWIGKYIAEKAQSWEDRVDISVIHLGDHWDMPSLSSYDKGKRAMEGRRYLEDIAYANEGFRLLTEPLKNAPIKSKDFLLGNHEYRVERAVDCDPQLEGLLSYDAFDLCGFERQGFTDIMWRDGVAYSHYFYNPMTGRPYSGENLMLRLKNLGHSFTMGHQQTLMHAVRFVGGSSQHGIVAGSAYLHDEEYKGPQGNSHWRGIVVCHNVKDGGYSPMFVDMDYLCTRYEDMPLVDFMDRL